MIRLTAPVRINPYMTFFTVIFAILLIPGFCLAGPVGTAGYHGTGGTSGNVETLRKNPDPGSTDTLLTAASQEEPRQTPLAQERKIIKAGSKYYLADGDGQFINNEAYDQASRFNTSRGAALVITGDKWKFINGNGDARRFYKKIHDIYNVYGPAAVLIEIYGDLLQTLGLSRSGFEKTDTDSVYMAVIALNGVVYGIDTENNILFRNDCGATGEIRTLHEGFFTVKKYGKGFNDKAIINDKGEFITDFIYDHIEQTGYPGIAGVVIRSQYSDGTRYGYRDASYTYSALVRFATGEVIGGGRYFPLVWEKVDWRHQWKISHKAIFRNGVIPVVTQEPHDPAGPGAIIMHNRLQWYSSPGSRYGWMNMQGELVSKLYDYIWPFENGKAKVMDRKDEPGKFLFNDDDYAFGLVDENFREILPPVFREIGTVTDNFVVAWVFDSLSGGATYDMNGNMLAGNIQYIEETYDDLWISYGDDFRSMASYIDAGTGRRISNFYAYIGPHKDGMPAPVNLVSGRPYNFRKGDAPYDPDDVRWGYIDRRGNEIVPPIYRVTTVYDAYGYSYLMNDDEKYTPIDTAGRMITGAWYDSARKTSPYRTAAVREGARHYLLDLAAGCYLTECDTIGNYDAAKTDVPVRMVDAGVTGYIMLDGTVKISPRFEKGGDFSEGFAAVRIGGKWGYIDLHGNMAVAPALEEAFGFSQGLAVVGLGGLYGYADTTGRIVIAPRFDEARAFREGRASVRVGNKWGFIDLEGNMTAEPVFDLTRDFSEGLAAVKVGKKWGYAALDGTMAVKPQYDDARDFHYLMAAVCRKGLWGHIDQHGTVKVPLIGREAVDLKDGKAYVIQPGHRKGIWIYSSTRNPKAYTDPKE